MRASSGVGLALWLLWASPGVARDVVAPAEVHPTVERVVRSAPRGTEGRALGEHIYRGLRDEGWLWARIRVGAERVEVEPGRRAVVAELQLGGVDAATAASFQRVLGLTVGQVYRPGTWEARAAQAVRRWGETGHPFARVNVRTVDADAATGEVRVDLWISLGPAATIAGVVVEGATSTRPDVLARLAGVSVGQRYRESDLERIRDRLRAREVIDDVISLEPRPRGTAVDEVDLHIAVAQPATTGRVAAALGVTQDAATQETRVSGRVDLSLLDLFGTARQVQVQWLDDGRTRRQLDLAYLEPALAGSSLDLELRLGQRHQDSLYDSVLLDLDLRIPWKGERRLELGVGLDRTTFEGDEAVVRSRRRARAAVSLGRRRPPERGLFGRFTTVLEAARVAETSRTDEVQSSEEITGQTILDASVTLGMAWRPRLATEVRARWQRVGADQLPLPPSEQWRVGGATTVRGYEEERFAGEQAAFGGVELQVGRQERAVSYAFVDLGWVEETRPVDEGTSRREHWLSSFGLGLRAPVASGSLDVSLGFPGRPSFEEGQLHVALDQRF